jgi:hypothetical protein
MTNDKNSATIKRMKELTKPIDQQILMCDSREDLLMMASVMLSRTKVIFDLELGEYGRKKMFRDLA